MNEQARLELASLLDQIPLEGRRYIAGLSESDVILLHHGLGMWVRDLVRAGEIEALYRWSWRKSRRATDLDDSTWPILVEVWKAARASQADGAEQPSASPS